MDFKSFIDLPIIDGHIHFPFHVLSDSLDRLLLTLRVGRVNLVSTPDPWHGNHNPALIYYKYKHPEKAYLCGGINYFHILAEATQAPLNLVQQIRTLKASGFDGIKLLESKPIVRKQVGIPLTSPVYEGMWSTIEEWGKPVVWHVADPPEFWDAQRVPDWAKQRGWFYGDGSYPTQETLYSEVDQILTRYPRLKVILAHFYFLSDQLQRAADFLEAHPLACFDMTPGSEMFFNFSNQPRLARDFFMRYHKQLVYGTDIGASAIQSSPSDSGLNRDESLGRAYVVRRFLEGDGEVPIPPGVSHWARPGERIMGIALPPEVLGSIYLANFERLFGEFPARLDREAALGQLNQLAESIDARAKRAVNSPARQVANELINS